MELTWYGLSCIRLRGKDAVVVNDPYPAIVGPTGRGITGDVVTYSHPDDAPLPKKAGKLSRDGGTAIPSSLEPAFVLDGPGEYEVHDVLLTGVRTYRDDAKGVERGRQTAFVTELDGLHTIHLGDVGHLLVRAQHAHSKDPARGQRVMRLRPLGDADEHQRRIEAHRAERVHGEAGGRAALVAGEDHRHPGGELREHEPEGRVVDGHGGEDCNYARRARGASSSEAWRR